MNVEQISGAGIENRLEYILRLPGLPADESMLYAEELDVLP